MEQLYLAYRKAKYELFNDRNSLTTLALLEYEENLHENLTHLKASIENREFEDIIAKFGSLDIPKDLSTETLEDQDHFFSNAKKHTGVLGQNCEVSFRRVIDCDINFHVLSALWVELVGQYIDARVTKNAYGSRLERINNYRFYECDEAFREEQKYNLESPKIFQSYQYRYQMWRDNGFKAIERLHQASSVIAVTMDISSFYHNVNLDEFTSETFYEQFGLHHRVFDKNPAIKHFHGQFIELLKTWNQKNSMPMGLPIGLSASPVLANAAMYKFDEQVEERLSPAYYGRYVDDIILVLADPGGIDSANDLLRYLVETKKLRYLEYQSNDHNTKALTYKTEFQSLHFNKSKQRVFFLDKESDLSMINAIKSEIIELSSEWRLMPDLADEESELLQRVMGFYSDGKEFNDALRKTDEVVLKRLGLSLLISHAHALNEYIAPAEWKTERYRVYDLIENYLLTPSYFVEHFVFVPRVFRLMIASNDGTRAVCFLKEVFNIIEKLAECKNLKTTHQREIQVNDFKDLVSRYANQILLETISFESHITVEEYDAIQNLCTIKLPSFDEIKKKNFLLFMRDLSFYGYASSISLHALDSAKSSYLSQLLKKQKETIDWSEPPENFFLDIQNQKRYRLICYFGFIISQCVKINNINLSNWPLLFPTRMFRPLEVSVLLPEQRRKHGCFIHIVNALRGTHSKAEDKSDKNVSVKYSRLQKSKERHVAVSSYEVTDGQWEQSVKQVPDLTKKRYLQLKDIVQDVLRKKDVDYFVLPELAIPRSWAYWAAKKLFGRGISFITGVEYQHSANPHQTVHNSAFMFLMADDLGFPYMKLFRQDKEAAAFDEGLQLNSIGGLTLRPKPSFKKKLLIDHSGFVFGVLICNELTNIDYRQRLRGNVDALFVVEWNRDLKSFDALVEASALDIHAYIVQANNRKYGDSRIRGPLKEDYDRDIVQVRGGEHDYVVVGKIDVKELRGFQSNTISPKKGFKPLPTGFCISDIRREWRI